MKNIVKVAAASAARVTIVRTSNIEKVSMLHAIAIIDVDVVVVHVSDTSSLSRDGS
jgi:hypothetical protein